MRYLPFLPLTVVLLVLMVAIPASAGTEHYVIGVQTGSTSDYYAAVTLSDANVMGYDSIDLAIEALKQRDVDFVLGDLPTLKFYQADSDGLSIAGSFYEADFGIGVAPGESDLLAAINVALGEIIDSGGYDTIFAATFGDEIVVLTDDTDANTATAYPAEPTGKLADVLTAESLVFGTDPYYPPFESYDADNNVVGFDADVAAAIGAKIAAGYNQSLNVTMHEKTWDELLAFGYDDYDATLSAMTKTAQRAENTDFTRAYYSSKQGILASADSPTISGVADLNGTYWVADPVEDGYPEASPETPLPKSWWGPGLIIMVIVVGGVGFLKSRTNKGILAEAETILEELKDKGVDITLAQRLVDEAQDFTWAFGNVYFGVWDLNGRAFAEMARREAIKLTSEHTKAQKTTDRVDKMLEGFDKDGVDVRTAFDTLEKAQTALSEGKFEEAKELLENAEYEGKNLEKDYSKSMEKIDQVKAKIAEFKEKGINTDELEKILKKAEKGVKK